MKTTFLYTVFAILIGFSSEAQKQSKTEQAQELKKTAIEKMDNGQLDESIALLKKAKKLDNKDTTFDYEIAYANYKKENYKEAIEILEKIVIDINAHVEYYRLLGNAYDMDGQPDRAIAYYGQGMIRFPEQAGRFYSESGAVELGRKNYDKAISYWEKGIKAEPYYSSNYYRLCNIYAMTDENIWTLFYGEMFMNLEMNTARTEEISKLLYDTYKKTYVSKSDTEGEFLLTKNTTVYVDPNEKIDNKNILNFELTYLTAYSASGDFLKGITIKNIYNTKKNLNSFWNEKGFNKQFPNKLLDFENKMIADNVFEAYVYWMLSEGNNQEFLIWIEKNKDKFQSLVAWVKQNEIDLKPEYKYSRPDYLQH